MTSSARISLSITASIVYGFTFHVFTELARGSLIVYAGGRTDCCERCSSILFDNARPVLAILAGVACFASLSISERPLSGRQLFLTAWMNLATFQVFTFWVFRQLFYRAECTALYSAGPMIIGVVAVVLVVIYNSVVWAMIAATPMFVLSIVRRLLMRPEPQTITFE